ncbi:MAG: hypothetical protein P8R42_08705 [Candidatus Binatia bacterium]|nr:hypothetical protein [Candidatus Binatia bacterium]
MRFIHCEQCRETVRIPLENVEPATADDFRERHASCRLRIYEPTGRAEASGTWQDPMSTRRLEVRGDDGLAMAVAARRLLAEPLVWHIEQQECEEELEVELDRALFWASVDRTLYPSHLPKRTLEEWATQLEHFARSARPEDIVLLEDDPRCGNATFACFTITARARLESGLAAFGFDAETQSRLAALFDQELFPPLRVERRLVPAKPSARAEPGAQPALTR